MLALQITLFIIAIFVLFTVIVAAHKHEINGKGFIALILSGGYIIWAIISIIIHFMS